jgi:ABC-type transport system involved in cytochrome bd biosynthesis fused ATPase/permease subunit
MIVYLDSVRHALWVFLETLFHWPEGIVVGNLIASVLWVPFTLIHLHRRSRKNLAEQTKELKAHVKEQLSAQTTEIKDHVTEATNAG